MSVSRKRGQCGEARAAAFLTANGYRIVEKNFRTPRGEVDIVAVREEALVFVEVKSWRVMSMTELGRSINRTKRSRIRNVAAAFRKQKPQYSDHHVRFDILFISSQHPEVTHLTNAF